MDEEGRRLAAGWARLLRHMGESVRLRPVGEDPADNRAWVDRDIASIAEGMFGERLDPAAVDVAARARVAARLPRGWGLPSVEPGEGGWTRWWIETRGGNIGTLALLPPLGGRGYLRVASLYVDRGARRRGAASAALDLAQDLAVLSGLGGIALDTEWTWGEPAPFYLRRGFWVRSWKRALTFVRGPHLPHAIQIGGAEATFSVLRDGRATPLLWAARRGGRLEWRETEAYAREEDTFYAAVPTFAVALALAGWPLVRSAEAWERSQEELDVGGPESLARRIEGWEAAARRDGVLIRTPRVPGLAYRAAEQLPGT